MLADRKVWLEVVTLVVPNLNDSEEELRDAARFLAGVSPDIPWHVTAFHDDYKMAGRGSTQATRLLRAAEIGREEGLRFVYAGNVPGSVGEWEDTRCPSCAAVVVKRRGFRVLEKRVGAGGACAACGALVPGIWSAGAPAVPQERLDEGLALQARTL
jgi:pyruvate formate lyase activating enzyme